MTGKLTARALEALALNPPPVKPTKKSDGGGLYLLMHPNGAMYWRLDFQLAGRRGTVGVGVYRKADRADRAVQMTLGQARAERDRYREVIRRGIRPTDHKAAEAGAVARAAAEERARRAAERKARRERATAQKAEREAARLTFERVAEDWQRDHGTAWTSRHAHQVRQSLEDHAFEAIGRRPISEITTPDVLEVLDPLLIAGKAETARRVRQRLSAIWQFAVLRGYTPADVVAPIGREFTRRKKAALAMKPRRNFPSVPPAEAPALLEAIRGYPGSPVTRAALQVLAYTFVRTGELRGASWGEFELEGEAPTWTVPVARMKVKMRGDRQAADHVVPLSRQAAQVLRELRVLDLDPVIVFPHSRKRGKVMSENTMLYALWELGYRGRMTGHGFRSIASTWLHEAGFDSALIEAQLAHEKSDRVEAAYNKAQHLERRRLMMQRYADFLDARAGASVIPMTRTA